MNIYSIFKRNGILLDDSKSQIVIYKQIKARAILPALVLILVLYFGFWSKTYETTFISILMSLICLLSIRRIWRGSVIIIIDKNNDKFILPSNNQYEKSSSFDTTSVKSVYAESTKNKILHYVFIEVDDYKLLLFKLRNCSKTEIDFVLNWMKNQISGCN